MDELSANQDSTRMLAQRHVDNTRMTSSQSSSVPSPDVVSSTFSKIKYTSFNPSYPQIDYSTSESRSPSTTSYEFIFVEQHPMRCAYIVCERSSETPYPFVFCDEHGNAAWHTVKLGATSREAHSSTVHLLSSTERSVTDYFSTFKNGFEKNGSVTEAAASTFRTLETEAPAVPRSKAKLLWTSTQPVNHEDAYVLLNCCVNTTSDSSVEGTLPELSTRGLPRSDGKFKPAEPSMMSRQSLCATPEPGPESPSACMFEWLQNVESHTSSDTHFDEMLLLKPMRDLDVTFLNESVVPTPPLSVQTSKASFSTCLTPCEKCEPTEPASSFETSVQEDASKRHKQDVLGVNAVFRGNSGGGSETSLALPVTQNMPDLARDVSLCLLELMQQQPQELSHSDSGPWSLPYCEVSLEDTTRLSAYRGNGRNLVRRHALPSSFPCSYLLSPSLMECATEAEANAERRALDDGRSTGLPRGSPHAQDLVSEEFKHLAVSEEVFQRIDHSAKFTDDVFEYRFVILPLTHPILDLEHAHCGIWERVLTEAEWRSLGIRQTRGWTHVGYSPHEANVLIFRRALGTNPRTGCVSAPCAHRVAGRLVQLQQLEQCVEFFEGEASPTNLPAMYSTLTRCAPPSKSTSSFTSSPYFDFPLEPSSCAPNTTSITQDISEARSLCSAPLQRKVVVQHIDRLLAQQYREPFHI